MVSRFLNSHDCVGVSISHKLTMFTPHVLHSTDLNSVLNVGAFTVIVKTDGPFAALLVAHAHQSAAGG